MNKLIVPFIFGYLIGRISHVAGGNNTPSIHHWIPGALLILASQCNMSIISFGLGLIVSDLNDFVNMRIYGIAPVEEYKLMGFD